MTPEMVGSLVYLVAVLACAGGLVWLCGRVARAIFPPRGR